MERQQAYFESLLIEDFREAESVEEYYKGWGRMILKKVRYKKENEEWEAIRNG